MVYMEFKKRQPIGIELIKKGLVTEDDVRKALLEQKKSPNRKLGEIIKDMNVCDSRALIQAIGEILGVKGVILTDDSIRINMLDYISLEMAKKYNAIPFDIEGDKIIFEENYNFEQDYLKIIVKMRISGTERSANTDELIEMATVYLRVNLENDTQLEEGA